MLTVPFPAFVTLPPLLLEDDDLLILLVLEDFGGHGSAFDGRRAESRFAVVDNHEDLVDLYLIAFVCLGEAVHEQFVALFYRELTALGLNGGFHVEENRLKNHFPRSLASVILAFDLFVSPTALVN